MKITTISGAVVQGVIDNKSYWEERKNHDLYRLTVAMCHALFPRAQSAIDVGCYTSSMLVEMDWIPKRVACDIQKNLASNWAEAQGVEFIPGDAFEIEFPEPFDLVISNQTVEHLQHPAKFVEKLLTLGKSLVISTTYETPFGLIPGHIQDPISLEKFKSWFPVEIDSWTVCSHPNGKIHHIIAVIRESHLSKRL